MKIAVTNPEDWVKLRRANYTHSDAASQGGGWWQGCGRAYMCSGKPTIVIGRGSRFAVPFAAPPPPPSSGASNSWSRLRIFKASSKN